MRCLREWRCAAGCSLHHENTPSFLAHAFLCMMAYDASVMQELETGHGADVPFFSSISSDSHRLADFRSQRRLNAHAIGAQVVGEVFGGHVQRVQQVGRGRHIWLPPPARNLPYAALEATIQPGHK